MKLATLNNGGRDGALVVVSRDHSRAAPAAGIAATLQGALERWREVEAPLRALAEQLEHGTAAAAFDFVAADALAPLPRAWQWLDGSAEHVAHAARTRPLCAGTVSNENYRVVQG